MEIPAYGCVWIAFLSVHIALSKGDTTCFGVGETATLSCEVTLTGGLTLRTTEWSKLGSPNVLVADLLGAAPTYAGRATINSTGFLLLDNVQQADEGTYRCAGTLSDFSSISTVDTELKIASSPANVACPSSVTANEFETITITCRSTACPSPRFEWENLPSGAASNASDSEDTVTIINVRKGDEGTVVCKAVNSMGEGTCQTSLTVPSYQPIVIAVLLDITVDKLEGSITVAPKVEGNPQPVITWVREGHPNQTGDSLGINSDSSMAGEYSCWATNDLGEVSCGTFTVTVTVWKLVVVIVVVLLVLAGVGVGVGLFLWQRKKRAGVTIKDEKDKSEDEKASDNPEEANTSRQASPLHGNNTSKSDVVFMIKEGQSHQVQLPPLVIDKENPAGKKSKKKKKRKKVNEVHASDEDIKPEG